MKYAQLIIGLLAGTAIGGAVIAGGSMGGPIAHGASVDNEGVKKIVRETIMAEPKLIMDSVQKFQQDEMKKQNSAASDNLKDSSVQEALYTNPDHAILGPKDSNRTIVEFFDYNCPVCKMQFKALADVMKKDATIRVILIEFPIFGPVSDVNAKVGTAVWKLYPEKYYAFHEKMMGTAGHGPGNNEPTFKFAKELGMDVERIKAEIEKPEIAAVLEKNRELGSKLRVQGTPMIIIGDEAIPHAVEAAELEARVNAADKKGDAPAEAPKP